MNSIPETMWDIWESGLFVGPNRPNTRVLVSKHVLKKNSAGGRSLLFNPSSVQNIVSVAESYELPNVATVEIDRRLGADAASIRITVRNNIPPDAGENLDEAYDGTASPTRRELRDLGRPGYFTFRRGVAVDTDGINPWSHDETPWVDLLIPNRVIKTFQGYGTDLSGHPANDTNLTLTGIWLIDKVEYKSSGDVIIEGRDMAKLAIEQKLYPPIVPQKHYPLEICGDRTEINLVTNTEIITKTVEGQQGPNVARHITSGWDSGNAPWYGINGSVYGHRPSHAFDGNEASYWLSMGNNGPNELWSFEWIGADCRGELVNRVRFKQKWGGYKVYLGVKDTEKGWRGSNIVPYGYWTRPAAPNDSNRPYIKQFWTARNNNWITVDMGGMWKALQVRLTFTNLVNSGLGTNPYRAAVYEFRVDSYVEAHTVTTVIETEEEVETLIPGNIGDYTSIVKILAAWSGWFRPSTNHDPVLTRFDPNLKGRVWGDFFESGAYPVDPPCIPPSFWDNKSVMDGINQIKEILGFIFTVDSTGGIQWRPPNIWRTGNYILGKGYQGETSVRTISEEKVLIDYGTTIDDENLRSDILVVSADDPSVYGAYQPGWAEGESEPGTALSDLALLGGQQRVMLVANYPFGTADDPNAKASIEKFAFLTSLWIHWSYRKSRFRIPGNPAFEIDDQVRIYERVTSETYVHYIEGYTSVMDLEAGTWFMDMDTHWLGNGPSQQWVIRSRDMHPALFAYLESIGQIPSEISDNDLAYPDGWFDYVPPTPPQTDIRVEDDYSHLFPLPPTLQWPSGDVSSEIPGTHIWVTEPNTGGGGGTVGGGTATNCSNQAMFAYWGKNCGDAPKSYIRFASANDPWQPSSIYLTVHSNAVKAFQALIEIIRQEQYVLKSGQCSSYNCRRIRRADGSYSSSWSNHSWATAVDLNSADLPQGRKAPAGHPVYRVAQRALGLRTGNGQGIFRWGGNWSGSQADPMHFEVCCKASDLSTGVQGFVPGSTGVGGAGHPI